ncbi:chitin deacetylase [Mortierella sp. GBA30]|nr:chitin deacetylase [Mortierella sp. GBA30]
MQFRASNKKKANNNKNNKNNKNTKNKNNKKSSSKEKGRNLVQASDEFVTPADETEAFGSYQPELWQLRAHGHHYQLKKQFEEHKKLNEKKQQAIKKENNKKKGAAIKDKKVVVKKKRDMNEKKQKQQKILAADAGAGASVEKKEDEDVEIDIAHDRKGKKVKHHDNPEDEEHDRHNPDTADELLDDYKQKHGGKTADEPDGDKKGKDGKTPKDGEGETPKDGAQPPKDGKPGTPVDGTDPRNGAKPPPPPVTDTKPPAAGTKPAPVASKPAPIIPVQHMGEFVTKCNTAGQIALTYSEGPSEATTQMLEILKEAKARVTFFANATWLEYMQYAGVTRRAYLDGHLIGMTYRLPNDSSKSMTDAQLKADIAKQATKIFELIGHYPKYVRLHDAGLKDPKLEPTMREMGYTLVGFNLDEADYKYNTREQARQIADIYETTFVKQADAFGRKGSYVVVGYDIPASGAAGALPDIITSIIRNEYDMVRLDGCNNDNAPYKKSPMMNDGFVADEFSFGAAKYVHGQSPVAVQDGKAVPGKMPAKVGDNKKTASGTTVILPSVLGLALAVFVAMLL